VTAHNACLTDSGGRQLDLDYTEHLLQYHVDVTYLAYSLYELTGDVTVTSQCDGGRGGDVIVSVTVVGVYELVSHCSVP